MTDENPDKTKLLRTMTRKALPIIAAFSIGAGTTWVALSFRSDPEPVQLNEERINMCMNLFRRRYAGSFAANCTKEERDFVFRYSATRD